MCNMICLSFQVHPRTLLGAACCPLHWWVVSYRERAAAIDVILFCMYYIHSSLCDNKAGAVMRKERWEDVRGVAIYEPAWVVRQFHLCCTALCWWYCTEGCCLCHLNVSLSFSLPHHKGELQRSCSRTVAEKVSEQCQLACHCRRYPPLPPPPPPPPPPRLLSTTGKIPSLVSHLSHFKAACLTLSLLSLHSWTPHLLVWRHFLHDVVPFMLKKEM